MALLAPPHKPALVTLDDGDRMRRLSFKLYLWGWTGATLLVTGWLVTLGLFPAIVAIVTAKHILVAILAIGLGIDARSAKV